MLSRGVLYTFFCRFSEHSFMIKVLFTSSFTRDDSSSFLSFLYSERKCFFYSSSSCLCFALPLNHGASPPCCGDSLKSSPSPALCNLFFFFSPCISVTPVLSSLRLTSSSPALCKRTEAAATPAARDPPATASQQQQQSYQQHQEYQQQQD